MKIFCVFLILTTVVHASDVKDDLLTWQKAYVNAYGSQPHKNQTKTKTKNIPSLADISATKSKIGDPTDSIYTNDTAINPLEQSDSPHVQTVEIFEIALCMTKATDIIENTRDGLACTAAYSCMSFWGQEVSLEMANKMWCITNAFEKLPAAYQSTMLAPWRKYLHNTLAPNWNYLMLETSPAKGQGVDLKTGKPTSALQVEASKNECENADSLPLQMRCMMRKIKEVSHIRPNLADLSPETFRAMELQYHSHKKAMSVLETEGLATLRQSIEDPIPLGFVEINPAPSPSNPPVPGRVPNARAAGTATPHGRDIIQSSVGKTMHGLASKNRYSALTPGLKMSLAEPTTSLIKGSRSNDGSPGALYLSRNSKKAYHVYWPGGYFCYNQEMCFERCKAAPMLCSTKGWEKTIVFTGTFNPTNGGMEGYTHAVLGYTSSDAFLGQTELSEFQMVQGTKVLNQTKLGTYFQGLSLGSAAIKKFQMLGLGQTVGTTLVISGCSAAAIGLAPLTDMIPAIMRANARAAKIRYTKVNVVIIQDSAPITNGPPPINGEMPLTDQSQALVYMLYTMKGLDPGLSITYPTCYAKFGTLCIWSPYVLPYLTVHNMVMHNLWDSFAPGNQADAAGGALNTTTMVWGLKLVFQEREVMNRCTN